MWSELVYISCVSLQGFMTWCRLRRKTTVATNWRWMARATSGLLPLTTQWPLRVARLRTSPYSTLRVRDLPRDSPRWKSRFFVKWRLVKNLTFFTFNFQVAVLVTRLCIRRPVGSFRLTSSSKPARLWFTTTMRTSQLVWSRQAFLSECWMTLWTIIIRTGQFFSKSCVPGVLADKYNTKGTNPINLCEACASGGSDRCQRNSEELYFGNSGAFRCLTESEHHEIFTFFVFESSLFNSMNKIITVWKFSF